MTLYTNCTKANIGKTDKHTINIVTMRDKIAVKADNHTVLYIRDHGVELKILKFSFYL